MRRTCVQYVCVPPKQTVNLGSVPHGMRPCMALATLHQTGIRNSQPVPPGFIARVVDAMCVLQPKEGVVQLAVHGDDFKFPGAALDFDWCKHNMHQDCEVKIRSALGPEPTNDNSIRILNKCVDWRRHAICYEADPRHAENVVAELGLPGSISAVAQSIKDINGDGGTL